MSVESTVGLRHTALLYPDDDCMLDEVVAFVEAGFDAGEEILIELPRATRELVLDALDGISPGVGGRLNNGALGDLRLQPHQALWGIRRHLDERPHESSGVRLVTQIDFTESPALQTEWGRVESLSNHVLRNSPLTVLCLYDESALDADLLRQARCTHPALMVSGTRARSTHYLDPRAFLSECDSTWATEALEASRPAVASTLNDIQDLAQTRADLDDVLNASTLSPDRCEDFRTAVFEVAANALLYGGDTATVRIWTTGDRVLCRVRDSGPGLPDALTGYEPPTADATTAGRGLWAARQLADLLTTTAEEPGFTVRVSIGH